MGNITSELRYGLFKWPIALNHERPKHLSRRIEIKKLAFYPESLTILAHLNNILWQKSAILATISYVLSTVRLTHFFDS